MKSAKSATNKIKDTCLPHHSLPQKSKKNDIIILLVAVYFYLYIYCSEHSEGSDTKQISRFFIMPGDWRYISFPLTFKKFGYIIYSLQSIPNLLWLWNLFWGWFRALRFQKFSSSHNHGGWQVEALHYHESYSNQFNSI